MYFSIPDTQELIDDAGNTYVGYNVHVNGLFHCTVRYKQLHSLHEQLTEEFHNALPSFPPKRFFPLTISQQEERRVSLERYIQTIGQNIAISGSELLNGFLLNAQQETLGCLTNDKSLDVFLMDSRKITVNSSVRDSSSRVLREVCDYMQLKPCHLSYFALFIVIQDQDHGFNILRKLQDFESPLITFKYMCNVDSKIMLARNYWDLAYELELRDDNIALDLLYVQAVAEVRMQWILVTDEKRDRLRDLENSDKKREYLDAVHNSKYYGYVQFAPCICDYPQVGSRTLVAIGRNELNLRILPNNLDQQEYIEATFKVSRMRCWRITTMQGTDRGAGKNDSGVELSFEYLIGKNQLQWITISSDQAILMSVCLQAMIDELLLKHVGGYRGEKEASGKSWTYVRRDGHSRITMGPTLTGGSIESPSKTGPIIKKLTDRLTIATKTKSPTRKHEANNLLRSNVMENNAFHMIGDEDL